ncbi:MAG: hypothetical protein JSS27_21200 [Planctomycetes bacterium]|nr:hypothetical protein [Planctomycetota bacterium]
MSIRHDVSRLIVRAGVFVAGLTLVVAGAASAADPLPSTIDCLPERTMVVVRMPSPAAMWQAMKERTKIGAYMTDPERLGKLTKIFRDAIGDEWDEFVQDLGKYQLKAEDLPGLFHGECSLAVIYGQADDKLSHAAVLITLEPSGDVGERFVSAIEQAIEEQKEDENPIARVDEQLAEQKVMRLTLPADAFIDKDDDDKAKRNYIDWHAFIARVGPRIAMLFTMPVDIDADESKPVDQRAASEAEAEFGRTTLGQYLAQLTGGSNRACKLFNAPGAAEVTPAGELGSELAIDLKPAVTWLTSLAAELDKREKDEDAVKILPVVKAAALDGLGPIIYRATLDGAVARAVGFVSAPSPRGGVLSVLDQTPLPAQPAGWVAADVLDYAHVSADLGKLYREAKNSLIGLIGEKASGAFGAIELQLQGALKTDVTTLLSSLGQQHVQVNFPLEGGAPPAGDPFAAQAMNRTAVVWHVKDEDLWRRVLETISAVGAGKVIEEQGFTGIRFEQGALKGGVFVGQNHLVVGVGSGVLEPVLAGLRRPPEGADALAGSADYRRARELLPARNGLFLQVSNLGLQLQNSRQQMQMAVDLLKHANLDKTEDDATRWLNAYIEAMKTLLPTGDEAKNLYGLQVMQGSATEHGLVIETVLEMTPRE